MDAVVAYGRCDEVSLSVRLAWQPNAGGAIEELRTLHTAGSRCSTWRYAAAVLGFPVQGRRDHHAQALGALAPDGETMIVEDLEVRFGLAIARSRSGVADGSGRRQLRIRRGP